MTPSDFLRGLKKGPASVYLFVGAEAYERRRCRRALIETALPAGEREQGFTAVDLSGSSITAVLDDAQSLSLFASRRLIWVSGAESALPRGRAAISDGEEDEPASAKSDTGALAAYVRNPAPGVVMVFDSSRYEFEGEDKARNERIQKFFAAIPNQVEFRPYSPEEARGLASELARERGLKIGLAELGMLVQALGSDAARIASEIEKLVLYAGTERKITAEDVAALVPNAQEATIFALAAALGAGNRARSLEALDTLVRDGEYLPLALNFLETQLRLALVARESNLKSAYEIQQQFTRMGIRIWRDRAEQVRQTLGAFPKEKLELAIRKTCDADRALRDARPDDRIVMEELILALTGG
jgi:DNA polymerase-3 subunit delta